MSDWVPHVTVATTVVNEGKFLLVKEISDGQIVFNQPAGHLEKDESLIDAAIRETREETRWEVAIQHYMGVSHYDAPNGITYIRHSFVATPIREHLDAVLDKDIIEPLWMTYEEVLAHQDSLRGPLVLDDITLYRAGKWVDLAFAERRFQAKITT